LEARGRRESASAGNRRVKKCGGQVSWLLIRGPAPNINKLCSSFFIHLQRAPHQGTAKYGYQPQTLSLARAVFCSWRLITRSKYYRANQLLINSKYSCIALQLIEKQNINRIKTKKPEKGI